MIGRSQGSSRRGSIVTGAALGCENDGEEVVWRELVEAMGSWCRGRKGHGWEIQRSSRYIG